MFEITIGITLVHLLLMTLVGPLQTEQSQFMIHVLQDGVFLILRIGIVSLIITIEYTAIQIKV